MLARGVVVTYETIRSWRESSSRSYAPGYVGGDPPRRRMALRDEVFVPGSTAPPTTCGARSTSTATCSTSWCGARRDAVTDQAVFRKLLAGACNRCRGNVPTSWPAIKSLAGAFCLVTHGRSKYLDDRARNSHRRPGSGNR